MGYLGMTNAEILADMRMAAVQGRIDSAAELYSFGCPILESELRSVFAALEYAGIAYRVESLASTGTRYFALNPSREVAERLLGSEWADAQIEEQGEGPEDCVFEITLRISDHGSAYCSEDFSFAVNPTGDDHDPINFAQAVIDEYGSLLVAD